MAKWMLIVDQVAKSLVMSSRIRHAIGSLEDVRQECIIALLQTIRSPKFKEAQRKSAYLANCIRNELGKIASESSLIRLPLRDIRRAAEANEAGTTNDRVRRVQMAMRLMLLGQMDDFYKCGATEDNDLDEVELSASQERSVASQDVCDAINSLPGALKTVMGHLHGVAGYRKLLASEIAERTGVMVETVWRRTYEGRRLLKKFLNDRGYSVNTGGQEVSNGNDKGSER